MDSFAARLLYPGCTFRMTHTLPVVVPTTCQTCGAANRARLSVVTVIVATVTTL